jgi:hypothetical protein
MTYQETDALFGKVLELAAQQIIARDVYDNHSYFVRKMLVIGMFTRADIFNRIDSQACEQLIQEWWRVSEWLGDELRAIGQPVLSNEHGLWWGRTQTGQPIISDGTIQEIVLAVQKRMSQAP